MSIIELFHGFNILMAWSIYAIVRTFIRQKKRPDIWWLLGILGTVMLISVLFDYGIAWYCGYLSEQINRASQDPLLWKVYAVVEILVAILTTLSLSKRIRIHKAIRVLQVLLTSVYLAGHLFLFGFRFFEYATSVIPGWHTTVSTFGNYAGLVFWLIIIVLINLFHRIWATTREEYHPKI